MEPKKTKRANVERQTGLFGNFFLLGLTVSTLLVIIAFQWRSYEEVEKQIESDIEVPEEEQIADITKQKQEQPKTKAPPEIKVVEDDVEIEDDQPEVQSADMVESDDIALPSGTQEKEKKEDKIFVSVQKEPSFPGGQNKLNEYIRNNLRYPRQAKEAGIEGVVYVNFVVNKDGSITNVEVKSGVTKSLNEEAKRVIRNMPDWKPGQQRGKKVRAYFQLPIRFSLSG